MVRPRPEPQRVTQGSPGIQVYTSGAFGITDDERFKYRLVLEIDFTAVGAGNPYFSINNIPLPFSRARLKSLRTNQEFADAGLTTNSRFTQGIQVRFDQDSAIFPVATGTVGGASTAGTTLAGFPTMRISVPAERNGCVIQPLDYLITGNQIQQINVQPWGAFATAAPAGTLVAIGDQVRIRLEMIFQILDW